MTLADVPRYERGRVRTVGDHAVVVGESVAGLTAARVLADAFADVTVLERDEYPDGPAPRRGVPHGAHIHALQEAGRATIEDLFPGFCDTVLARGGLLIDGATDLKFYSEGDYLADGPRRLPTYSASRPLFEHAVRTHATAVEGIDLRPGCQVTDYLTDETGTRVTGVEFRDEQGDERALPADVVVDATGRTSRTPEWLREQGYPPPELDEVSIDIGYSTTAVLRPPGDRRAILAIAEPPHTRGGAVFPVEDDLWLVNLHESTGTTPQRISRGLPTSPRASRFRR